ncbi:MAG: aldolase/citrate lyase family protein [Campylobacterota bacterium]
MSEHNSINALQLGGTLFVPASHKNIDTVLSGKKYPELRSVVVDFEDGLATTDRQQALNSLDSILENLQEVKLLRFIRPQNPQMLKEFLQRKNIDKINGFILPKFGLENASDYLNIIENQKSKIKNPKIMPSIEGRELFDIQQLQRLREILLPHQEQIVCIRFGAQDMLRQLGLRQTKSIYNMLAPAQVIANLITTFKPYGFDISAPVYPDFSDIEGFQKEIACELQNGLISKTIIHPSQIKPVNTLYSVTQQELDEARTILSQHDGVLNLNGKMGEVRTQSVWAAEVIERYNTYGIR